MLLENNKYKKEIMKNLESHNLLAPKNRFFLLLDGEVTELKEEEEDSPRAYLLGHSRHYGSYHDTSPVEKWELDLRRQMKYFFDLK